MALTYGSGFDVIGVCINSRVSFADAEDTVLSSKTPITVKDVAEMAGVHRTTASKVLNNDLRTKINEATRKRILMAAKRLGFVRNNRFVAPGGVRSFGLISMFRYDRKENPFFSNVFDGIDSEARKRKVNVYLINNTERLNLLGLLDQPDFVGMICVGGVDRERLDAFELSGKPLVGVEISRHLSSSVLYGVRTDQFRGMYELTRHLVQSGHRNIYYLSFTSGRKESPGSLERFEGVAMALREADIYTGKHRVLAEMRPGKCENEMAVDVGYRAMVKLLESGSAMPLACVCYSDLHAIGAAQAARDRGFRVPDDISLGGYDNIPQSMDATPPLTTVDVPRFELGVKAVEILLNIGKGRMKHDTVLPSRLVIRDSVRKLK